MKLLFSVTVKADKVNFFVYDGNQERGMFHNKKDAWRLATLIYNKLCKEYFTQEVK